LFARRAGELLASSWTMVDPFLPARVQSEFLEMPGLCLTLLQASRLWNTPPAACTHVLDTLVATGFLHKNGATYQRADTGRHRL
jgi:hypothetical protein